MVAHVTCTIIFVLLLIGAIGTLTAALADSMERSYFWIFVAFTLTYLAMCVKKAIA